MRLTRRGWFVLGIVLTAFLAGELYGARSLNAIVAPGVVALLTAAVQVIRVEQPSMERQTPVRGQAGDTVPVRIRFDISTPVNASIHDALDPGIVAHNNAFTTTLREQWYRYDLLLQNRGNWSVGPLSLTITDVLRLMSVTFEYPDEDSVLVHPKAHKIVLPKQNELMRVFGGFESDREHFDQLRLYQRGDSLRDIHWKSSAKQPNDDLVVKEFSATPAVKTVEVTAASTVGYTDEMAEAVASLVLYFLDASFEVGLRTHDERILPDDGMDHRIRLLDHLADVGPGPISGEARDQADLFVEATNSGTVIHYPDRQLMFYSFIGTEGYGLEMDSHENSESEGIVA